LDGLLILQPTREIVGKKSEYKTKEEFIECVREEECRDVDIESVDTAFMRYYPRGTEHSEGEFGKGEGIYQCVDTLSKGAFEVWIV
jgi:hypothetical protein